MLREAFFMALGPVLSTLWLTEPEEAFWNKFFNEIVLVLKHEKEHIMSPSIISVTRVGDFLYFGQLFKAFGKN